jgi:hypothetical protein
MPGRWLLLLAISVVILLPPMTRGQSDQIASTSPDFAIPLPPRITQPPTVEPPEPFPWPVRVPRSPIGFPQIARPAGMVFSGTVTAIARRPATHGQAIETVAITFHVEQAIRGATPGEDLTITQWMGLWSSGQRYRIGERLMLFLYPPSKLGLTSSVGGGLGRFAVDPVGRVLLTAQHLSAFRQDAVVGGKSRISVRDFALAVRRASQEE